MAGPVNNLQDVFLNAVRRARTPVTMFLVKGVKLQGVVTWFDNFSLLLRRDGQAQLVYKHGISTIVPNAPVEGFALPEPAEGKGKAGLQDTFLAAAQGAGDGVTAFLVNGVMLSGEIAAFDLFTVLLRRDAQVQLVYKHALSTVQPNGPIHLGPTADEAEAEGQAA